MAKKWTVEVDGSAHEVRYQKGLFKSKIIVDGAETPVKSKSAFIQLIDEPISIGSKTLHLTAIGAKIDLAADGVYLNSGKPYVSLSKIPGWATVITILLLIFGWFMGGLIGLVLGLLGGMIVLSNSLTLGKGNPLPLCLVIAAATAVLQTACGIFLFQLLNG